VTLSKQKIGAIITFEKKDSLNDVIKSGTILNAPVVPELLLTIFYEGTRLHDGAVIIRDDKILAASVYFTPTTRPLTGKFGSRHRAAIGISEITDSVTVVVSEETGRISIAYDGELQAVAPDTFLKSLKSIWRLLRTPRMKMGKMAKLLINLRSISNHGAPLFRDRWGPRCCRSFFNR
jgi:diadenylate cyclase